ncbi:hypothetical protein GQ53DRAFT_843116 [Thozetella sp. PMI_491]|nr:hypothetical protein GQ53DRAFT_843116 [Thozetella sp. PMI_491]
MSNALKRILNPADDGEDDGGVAGADVGMANTMEAVDLNLMAQPNAWLDQDAFLDPPRQSQYLGPGYMNSESSVAVMQPAMSLPGVFNYVMPDLRVDNDMFQTGFDNMDYYNLDAALADWGISSMESNNISSPSSFGSSQLNPVSSQETSLSSSATPSSTELRAESVSSVENEEELICYGMLHNVDVKVVGDLKAINDQLGTNNTGYGYFKINEQQDHVLLSFYEQDMDFGHLRSGVGKTLTPLLSKPNVEFEPTRSIPNLRETIGNARKSAEAMVKVDINIYGPRRMANDVGEALSNGKLWLQKPDHARPGMPYNNPHFLPVKINGVAAQCVQPQVLIANEEASRKKSRDQQLRKMVEEVYKSMDNTRHLEMVEGGDLVAQKLLKHQQEALGFMLERESGHISERYRLWEKIDLEDGREEYRHKITKAKRVIQPEERGGGILADEMGLGKSLSILALITKTLDDAKEWAQQHNENGENKKLSYSRSTLVVVSSALLVYNWMNEIRKHLKTGLTVVKYHGPGRVKNLEAIQDSDIIVTTYSTLAAEYQVASRLEPSLLHRIGWYRVVLDEAHTIRRPATVFNHACGSLEANSRWCLTGTPIQNKLADIGTLFAFIRADPFCKAAIFRKWIEIPFEQSADDPAAVKNRLVMLLEALCLRRTKEVIELPRPRQTLRRLSFSRDEREQYEKTKKTLLRTIKQRVGEVEKSKFGLFQANLQMRILCNHGTFQKAFSWQRHTHKEEREAVVCALGERGEITCSVCQQPMPILGSSSQGNGFIERCAHVLCAECIEEATVSDAGTQTQHCPVCVRWRTRKHPDGAVEAATDVAAPRPPSKKATEDDDDYYFDLRGHSTKMEALIEDISNDLWATKSIVFSCWTRTLHLLSRHLLEAKIPFLRIDGDCLPGQRQQMLDQFARDERMPVLIMTTGTGAFGLNLTCANRVFIVELQWNPAVENQAIARAIRLGQDNEVQVTRYVIKDTVEEEMMSQQQWKKQLAAIGFDDVEELS